MRQPRVLKGSLEELETPEHKLRSFLRLTLEERLQHLEDSMRFVAAINPQLAATHEDHAGRSVRILSLP